MSTLLIHGVPIECINQAAIQYFVPAKVIISVLSIENGQIGQAKLNKNGTYDYGPMQINSIWLDKVRPYGYTLEQIQYDPCVNVTVGTWILSQAIANAGSIWQGVGDYHSHTINKNLHYRTKVESIYTYLEDYLNGKVDHLKL
ncbi:MAG: lytic transglycosylase domain-containing protein [Gammaproteobacteria bacterium]